jgi:nicotinamidase-related amidase
MSDSYPSIDPGHTALLIMDYQVGILKMLEDPDVLLSRAADAIATLRRHGGHIGYVRVAFEDADVEAIPTSNKSFSQLATGTAWRNDSPETAIHERVAPESGDIIVRKTRVGAFSTTDLDEQLRRIGVTTLILAGVSTSGVVLSTVRDAADRDYQVFVLADATADRVPEVHEIHMESVYPRQADVITSADLDGLLSPLPPR